jgi:hypothetical protein
VSILTQFVLGEGDDDPADGLGRDEEQEHAPDDLEHAVEALEEDADLERDVDQ